VKAKIIVPAILIFLWCSDRAYSQILVGPVAGGNVSWIKFNDKDLKDEYRVKPVFGFHAGAQISFRVRKRFFLHSSLIYSTKGKVVEGKNQPLEIKAQNSYIEMPIVYTVNFRGTIGKKPFKYFAGIGPNISYWLGGKGTIENTDTHEFSNTGPVVHYKVKFRAPPESRQDIGDEDMMLARANRIQLGINLTTGLVFEPAPFREMMVTLRYERGHSFWSRESNGVFKSTYYEDIMQVRNQGIRLSVAYMIDLRTDQRKKGKSTFDKKKF
jgi:hypothetical protein